ncbi:MAG: OsmC family protein [Flavipsychrobacter sp.]|nr:OsmC family protein [Flavipsychrobacter sp.]
MTAKVVYNGDLRTTATHLRSGSEIETDAPVDNKGKGERFSPTDLVAVALATCIFTTLGIAESTHDINIDGAECEVEKIMVSNPRKIGEIKIHISFPKSGPYTDKDKIKIEHIANTCPVFQSLHPDCKKTITFSWPE